MADTYRDQVEFLLVYVREAHPVEGWRVDINDRAGIVLPEAKDAEQKEQHADICVLKLDIRFTTIIDNMDNQVELDYAAWPDRLYLVGRDGRIAWTGRPGPMGFRPRELERAIEAELGK